MRLISRFTIILYLALNYLFSFMQQGRIFGKWQTGNQIVKVDVPVILFEEADIFYCYLPSLDLTGYGKSRKEADNSLKINLESFLDYTLNKKTLLKELKRLG